MYVKFCYFYPYSEIFEIILFKLTTERLNLIFLNVLFLIVESYVAR